ncbi:MAG: hypothetical protein RR614_12150, partial [Eubacterium sp.]
MIQIDTEMPESCDKCDCLYKYKRRDMVIGICPLVGNFVSFGNGRDEDCPLVETGVKPQTWHVVADGDLPEKRNYEDGEPIEFIVMLKYGKVP